MKITFIGLGIMGSRMSANLLKNNVDVTVYNRSESAMESLVAMGATKTNSLEEAVSGADIVFSMLSTPQVVRDTFWSGSATLAAMKKNALWVDCSTVNPSFSRECHHKAVENGIRFVDAPVSGSKPQAEQAILAFFVGGEKNDLDLIKPFLEMMGKKIIHVGGVGMGTSLKLVVNSMLATSMLLFSESAVLGKQLGISEEILLDTLPQLPVTPPFIQFKTGMIKSGNYETQFPLEWAQKDLALAVKSSEELGRNLPLVALASQMYEEAKISGMGRADFSAIYGFLDHHKS